MKTAIWSTLFHLCAIVFTSRLQSDGATSYLKWTLLELCLQSKGVDTRLELVQHSEPHSGRYADSNFQYNQCCGGYLTPKAYLVTTEVAHIQTAVICARQYGVRIVSKAGGHSFGKYSFGDPHTLVVDLRPMNQINVFHGDNSNPMAIVEPGVLLAQLSYKIYNEGGFLIPLGDCVVIGVTMALGGGYSPFSRLHGMTSDSLVELEMVDANGRLLVANNQSNPDLFWALRGAGAGSFGIVTRYHFKLLKAPHVILYGTNEYDIAQFPQVFDAYQKLLQSDPPGNVNPYMKVLFRTPDGVNKLIIHIFQHQTRKESSEVGDTKVKEILAKFPVPKYGTSIRPMSMLDFVLEFGYENGLNHNVTRSSQLGSVTGYDYDTRAVVRVKSALIPASTGILDRTGILKLYDLVRNRPRKYIYIYLNSYGGKINDVGPSDTAFVHRSQILYEIHPIFCGTKEQEPKALEWLRLFYNTTKSMMGHKESFQNHLDIDLPDYLERYYGQNLKRLVEVKRKFDPNNVFYHPQSIPTSY